MHDKLRALIAQLRLHGMAEALDGEIEPFLGALFDFESHASRKPQHSQQPDRLVRETVNRQRANLPALDVRQAVGGIKKQSPRSRIQRNGNRIERKIAPPQVFHDG